MILTFGSYVITQLKTLEKILSILLKDVDKSGFWEVIISSILVKSISTKFIRQLNDILISLCLVNDSYFISNDNRASHDGVHLNKDDTCTVARNVIHFRSPSHT